MRAGRGHSHGCSEEGVDLPRQTLPLHMGYVALAVVAQLSRWPRCLCSCLKGVFWGDDVDKSRIGHGGHRGSELMDEEETECRPPWFVCFLLLCKLDWA